MRKTEPSHRAPPTSNGIIASFAAAASGRKPTSSVNAPHYFMYASAITSMSTGPLVASRRARNAPWPKRSYTYSTFTNPSKNGANSGRDSGPRHTDA